jgi:hypothetical protein
MYEGMIECQQEEQKEQVREVEKAEEARTSAGGAGVEEGPEFNYYCDRL